MATENTISQNLYDLLITRNFDPETTDQQGQASQPGEGSVFTFDWISSKGTNYGTAVIVLTDDNELQLFFGDNLGKSMDDAEDKQEWFDFMQQLSQFATRNNFNTFTPRNISQLKHTMAGMAAIAEGLFEGYYGTRRMSYMGEQTQARLVIQHNRVLGENDKRYHNIDKLFIETVEGERFKLPFRNLAGGRAMLEHVRQGGRPYDIRGNHITEMVSELAVLNRFRRANHGQIREAEVGALVEQVDTYYQQLQENLKRLSGARGYSAYFESWSPATVTQAESLVEDLKTLFVEQTIDHRIEAALPVLAKIQNQGNRMKEADIFEQWANRITEGTWAMPETPQQQARLKELMSQELIVGPDATNATQQLYDLIGDDELFDQLADLAQRDPDADARPVVMARLQELGLMSPQNKEPVEPTVQEGDNLATFVEAVCNETQAGESCPVHGLAECGMHESLRDSEYHIATVTLDDGSVKKVRITTDEGFRDRIQRHFQKQGREVTDIDVDYAVRTDEDSTDPMDRRGGVLDSFYEAQESNPMAQAVTRRIVNQHPEWIMQYGVEFLMQVIDDITEDEDWEEIGSSDVSAYVDMVHDQLRDRGGDRSEMADRRPFAEQGGNKPRFTDVPRRDSDPPKIQSTRVLPPAPGRPGFTGKPDRQSSDPLERLKNLAFAKTR